MVTLERPAPDALLLPDDIDFLEEGDPRSAIEPESIDETVERLIREFEIDNGPIDLGRADPPENEWPGRWIDIRDVANSSGDERDWFTFRQRARAHVRLMRLFRQARRRRRKLSSGFDFAQIMWVGDMGASKSVSACEEALYWFQRGHPFFHNGGFNFGRLVEGSDIYEIVARVPMYSVIAIDEAHTGLESGMAMSTGIRGFAILCAGLRKKGCKLLLMSAMARMIVRVVREMTSEVRRPFQVQVAQQTHGFKLDYPNHSDPRNFVLAWEVWRDFPFRGVDIVDGKGARKRDDGLGPADDMQGVAGETVRMAYMGTDSFRPVDTAQAQRFAGKAAMEAAREAAASSGLTDDHRKVVGWLYSRLSEPGCPAYLKTAAIALNVGLDSRKTGQLMDGVFGDIDNVKGTNGWKTEGLKRAIYAKFGLTFETGAE